MELTAHTHEQQETSRRLVMALIAVVIMFYFGWRLGDISTTTAAAAHALKHSGPPASAAVHAHPEVVPPAIYSVFPFVLLLLAIALLPIFRATEHWWEANWNRFFVAVGLGAATLCYYTFLYGHGVVDHTTHALSDAGWPAALTVLKNAILVEYIPFITLLFSLYVISGGISIEGHLVGTPRLNTTLIGIGGLLASFIGTTGAAMLLIRPLLRANRHRGYVAHTVVFFIFIVCNTGGCLLPIGDPPLFLGYLRGVNFGWTLSLWPMWLFTNLVLLAVYYAWDSVRVRQEAPHAAVSTDDMNQPFAIAGRWNILWLAGVIAAVAFLDPSKAVPGTQWHAPVYFREIVMLCLAGLSLLSTSAAIRRDNAFNYDAILEVAALFIGIFICMQAPIQILNEYGPQLGIDSPDKFYWGTGILSSFLDNAPTYVVFFETAKSMHSSGASIAGVAESFLIAISLGAVFMGAMTYIGNGPNFMVKAIAEKNNVRMPSFFGYMLYSCGVLLPISLAMTWLFL